MGGWVGGLREPKSYSNVACVAGSSVKAFNFVRSSALHFLGKDETAQKTSNRMRGNMRVAHGIVKRAGYIMESPASPTFRLRRDRRVGVAGAGTGTGGTRRYQKKPRRAVYYCTSQLLCFELEQM